MPKQPVPGSEVTEYGVNCCGIMACLNFRRFLQGLEIYAPPTGRSKRGSRPDVAGDWVQSHMAHSVSPVMMECARAHGMRHLLSAVVRHGCRISNDDAQAMLKDAYQAWCGRL